MQMNENNNYNNYYVFSSKNEYNIRKTEYINTKIEYNSGKNDVFKMITITETSSNGIIIEKVTMLLKLLKQSI